MIPAAIDVTALERTLCQLGRVERLDDLGTRGPLLASAGLDSLFHCLFGRDALRMAFDLLDDFPSVARCSLIELARLQGVRDEPRGEEEPGRILHEHRLADDPLRADLEQLWTFPYYGAVDSTPQWIALLAAYAARFGDAILDERVEDRLGRRVTLWDSLEAALGWIVGRLNEPSGGGYLWVRRSWPAGIPNQVWEDSGDSYYHADGTIFDFSRPYAPVAVQGYTYDALLGAAELLMRRLETGGRRQEAELERAGRDDSSHLGRIEELTARAAGLRARFLRDFWQPDLGTFALALTFNGGERAVAGEHDDSDSPGLAAKPATERAAGRPARVVASSPGHLLESRLLDGEDVAATRDRLVRRLFEPDLLAGPGIRTRSTGAARFRAGSYHNGSVWPMDTGVISDGLRRHGYDGHADDLESRILTACARVGGFPEFFRGDVDGSLRVNVETIDEVVDGVSNRLEQPPQRDQGWTATRVWRILRSRRAIIR